MVIFNIIYTFLGSIFEPCYIQNRVITNHVIKRLKCILIDFVTEEPPKPIIRTKTSVSNDYQFSPCAIQQLGNTFMYNYEYLGPGERLVLTPLTQRAFLSLTQAMKNFHCGTLIGPAGRGKSETIKDLAKV